MNMRNKLELDELQKLVRTIPDYPHEGILFRDITTLIANPDGLRETVHCLAAPHHDLGLTYVAGIEARGFILGAALAIELGVGFVPIRKKGKLPGSVLSREYALEYGTDVIEIHDDVLTPGDKVLVVDDLIATGGTAEAGIALCREAGAVVDHAAFVIDLPVLGGADKIRAMDVGVHIVMEFDGH